MGGKTPGRNRRQLVATNCFELSGVIGLIALVGPRCHHHRASLDLRVPDVLRRRYTYAIK